MKPVKIKCAATGTSFWVAVDDQDLLFDSQGETRLSLASGLHQLTWWMLGKPNDTIKIEVSVAGVPSGKVDTKIPSGDDMAAGYLPVQVQ